MHGSVLDLEVDTGEFPVAELKDLLRSLHQKKRYHRLRDGRLLRLDDSLEGLDELNDTLELPGPSSRAATPSCRSTVHPVSTGRSRARTACVSTATMRSAASAAAFTP